MTASWATSGPRPRPASGTPGDPPPGRPAQPRVLLVDESPPIRAALRRLLEDEGMQVTGEAGTAKEAIAAVIATRPDVVLTDLRLDGLALTAAIVGVAPGTQVVICTALAGSSLDEHARRVGAYAVVAKGSHPGLLVRAIEQAATREGVMRRPA